MLFFSIHLVHSACNRFKREVKVFVAEDESLEPPIWFLVIRSWQSMSKTFKILLLVKQDKKIFTKVFVNVWCFSVKYHCSCAFMLGAL